MSIEQFRDDELVIEDGVELPAAQSKPGVVSPFRKTLQKLTIGQSFLVSIVDHKLDNLQGAVHREREASGREFTWRRAEEGYARIWRTK